VAKAAEPLDWAVSAHHYIEAEHRADAMRVLRESAIEAVGTARWGAATALVDRMPDQPIPEAVNVLRAYSIAARGQVERAVTLLEELEPSHDDTVAWGLTRVALASLYLVTGQLEKIKTILDEVAQRDDLGKVITSLARGISIILETHRGGNLSDAVYVFHEMAREQEALGLTYFAGVSYHNCALALFARGEYQEALAMGRRGVDQFNRTPSRDGIDSTHALLALACMELGQDDRASEYLEQITLSSRTLADAQADAGWIAAAKGDSSTAWVFIERAAAASRESPRTPGAFAAAQYSRLLALLADGSFEEASHLVSEAGRGSVELDAAVRSVTMTALLALVAGDRDKATTLSREGLALAQAQGASHWARPLRVLEAVGSSDADGFRRSLADLLASSKLSALVFADAVAMGLGLADHVPSSLHDHIRSWPNRWLPALRRVVQGSERSAAMVAAELLSSVGSTEDIALLAAFERRHIRQATRRSFSRTLARHLSPTLVVHDLGRLQIQVGQRIVALSKSRRKAASLLALLASRTSHAATRDQVLDVLWPHQSPEGAANSLHQTLFFLRREIDPWFEDGCSVDYVVVEPDVVYLDADLVQVDSAAFFRQVSAAMTSGRLADMGAALLRDYHAKFALDFEYEDWSVSWREQLHGLFLEAAQATATALMGVHREQLAVDVMQRALAIDPTAIELEAKLIAALRAVGATAAASHQYRHYAQAFAEETGGQAPSLASLCGETSPER
jgi:DNA-binding SARP family transcriptional activator